MLSCSFGLLLLGLFFLLAENCYLDENCTISSQYPPPLSNAQILAFEGGFLWQVEVVCNVAIMDLFCKRFPHMSWQ